MTTTAGGDVPTELVQTRSELPDGTLVQEGALLNGVFLDLGGLEALGQQLASVTT